MNTRARRLSLLIVGSLLVVDLVWLPFSALRISASNAPVAMLMAASLLLAGPVQRRYRFSAATINLAIEVYILLLFAGVGFIFSYLTVESGCAIRDDLFVSIDRFLGFDWISYNQFVLRNDTWHWASRALYIATPLLLGLALLRFCIQGHFSRASEVAAMIIVGGVLCVVFSGLFPGVGGSGYFPTDNSFYEGREVIFDTSFRETFHQLRNGAGMDVDLLRPVPLIAFPSYHACLAVLVMLVFRETRGWRWPMLALSAGSMFSLPVEGGHHLTDVLGGLLVGAAAYWLVRPTGRTQTSLRRDRLPGTG